MFNLKNIDLQQECETYLRLAQETLINNSAENLKTLKIIYAENPNPSLKQTILEIEANINETLSDIH
jgi:hypothetical protein